MKILLGIIVIALIATVLYALITAVFSQNARDNRAAKKAGAAALTVARNRERIATKALRAIVNGSARPDLEAQIALDEIEKTYDYKEIV